MSFLEDPELLAQLASLGGAGGLDSNSVDLLGASEDPFLDLTEAPTLDAEVATLVPGVQAMASATAPPLKTPAKTSPAGANTAARVQQLKAEALALKQQGKKVESLAKFREYKALESPAATPVTSAGGRTAPAPAPDGAAVDAAEATLDQAALAAAATLAQAAALLSATDGVSYKMESSLRRVLLRWKLWHVELRRRTKFRLL